MSRGWTNLLKRKDIIAKLEKILIPLPKEKEKLLQIKLDLAQIYPENLPCELEIGCGKGEFIANKATTEKKINFLGIEAKQKRIISTIQKLTLETKNVKLLKLFLDKETVKILPSNCFQKIYINYPDPWPKAKHHKNRLINDQFVALLPDLLQKQGYLQIITDDQEYALQIDEALKGEKKLQKVNKNQQEKLLANRQPTYFEKLKLEQGFAPNIFLYQKI